MKTKQNKKAIWVAGVEFDPINFPKLYRFAEQNPEGLEALLVSLAEAHGYQEDLRAGAIILENDLEHG